MHLSFAHELLFEFVECCASESGGKFASKVRAMAAHTADAVAHVASTRKGDAPAIEHILREVFESG